MFKRGLILGLLAGGMLTLEAAERPYITPVNYPTPTPVGASYTGVVTNIDPVNLMIQFSDEGGMLQTVIVDSRIQVRRNGSVISFPNIALGDLVTVVSGSKP